MFLSVQLLASKRDATAKGTANGKAANGKAANGKAANGKAANGKASTAANNKKEGSRACVIQ